MKATAKRAGADDYALGPLSSDLLLQRLIDYQVNTIGSKAPPKLAHGELILDLAAYVVR